MQAHGRVRFSLLVNDGSGSSLRRHQNRPVAPLATTFPSLALPLVVVFLGYVSVCAINWYRESRRPRLLFHETAAEVADVEYGAKRIQLT
jgi:hypothetical protein